MRNKSLAVNDDKDFFKFAHSNTQLPEYFI